MCSFMCWLQALYVLYNPDGEMFKLPYCIIIFGFVQFLMSQLPDLHSLRFLNALSNFCTVTFSTIAVGMSIHNGEPIPCTQREWLLLHYPASRTTVTCRSGASKCFVCIRHVHLVQYRAFGSSADPLRPSFYLCLQTFALHMYSPACHHDNA